MTFRANPKPTDGQWLINGESFSLGSDSLDRNYTSSVIFNGVSFFV
jgi:hypothetical protein